MESGAELEDAGIFLAGSDDEIYNEATRLFNNSPFSELRFRTLATPLPQLATPSVQAIATTDSITVSWNEVTNAIRYKVSLYEGDTISSTRVGTAQMIDVADERTAVFTEDITLGTQYTAAVVAIPDRVTYSDSDPSTTQVTTEQLPQLTTPTVTATATANSITATWNEVVNAVSYEASLYTGSSVVPANQVSMTQTIDAASARTASFTGLNPDTQYTVAVVAIANPATHRDSDPGTAMVRTTVDGTTGGGDDDLDKLTTPDVTATATANSITATWDEVADAVDYEVSLYEGDDTFGSQVGAQTTTGLSYMFTGLTPGTTYTVAVVAVANPATHRDSDPRTVTITTNQLPQLATSQNVLATPTTDSITVSWDEVADATSYEVSLYTGSSVIPANQVGTQTIDVASARTASFTGLTPATEYTVAVVAIADPATHRDSEAGTATITTDQLPQLATPQNVLATPTTDSITATWNEVVNAISYEVSLYTGSSVIPANQVGTQTIDAASARTASFTGLTQPQHTQSRLLPSPTQSRTETAMLAQRQRQRCYRA